MMVDWLEEGGKGYRCMKVAERDLGRLPAMRWLGQSLGAPLEDRWTAFF